MAPKMVVAQTTDRGRMHYLVDDQLDFIPEVKAYLDLKALRCAPATIEAYCARLRWFFTFLHHAKLSCHAVRPPDLVEFVLWLCTPAHTPDPLASPPPQPLSAIHINHILSAVHGLYAFLVRRGELASSPVTFVDVPRSRWSREHDLLAHIRRGAHARTVPRMELKLKVPACHPKIIAPSDFAHFLDHIHVGLHPSADPSGFRDRLLCLFLKESGARIGEALGIRLADLCPGEHGVWLRFRPDNVNQARAKAGYGHDRFVSLPPELLGLLDMYLTEVWIAANPSVDYLWLVLKPNATNRAGQATYGTALSVAAAQAMFRHYAQRARLHLTPHMLRHTHATDLVRSFLTAHQPVDWKFVQERLGHASVVTTIQLYIHLTTEDRKHAYAAYQRRKEAADAVAVTREPASG